MIEIASQPADLAAAVALRDGSVAHVRRVRPDDESRLLAFLQQMPLEDRRLRFFGLGNNLARTAHDEASLDPARGLGLIVTVGPEERVVGHAMYVVCGPARAEVAFSISHDFQSRGIATLLLGQLAEAAAAAGITTFEATMLRENRRMLQVFRESGFPVEAHYEWDTIGAAFPTALTPEALARFDEREEYAAASALQRIVAPHSVAVIGGFAGDAIVQNLVAHAFPGPIYPVTDSGKPIHGLPGYASVEAIPDVVDLAVVAVAAREVLEAARECGRKGVHAIVVLTAGYDEVNEAELVRVCRDFGMRLVGPESIGVINTDPRAPLDATFAAQMPPAGRIGMATQSDALGLAAIDFTAARALGLSTLVSMGSKADISGNDLLGYWHTDPRTDVILLYLESFGNPRKFARLARTIGRSKPIVALKSGRSSVGARASSHIGAVLAGSDVTVDALFRQAGVIRTDTLDEMLDVADLLVHQPLPTGPRVAIVTNVAGPASMCADTCEARGLQVIKTVNLRANATATQYQHSIRLVASDPTVDAIISIFLAPLATQPDDVGRALCRAVDTLGTRKPVLAVFMSPRPLPALDGIPGYHTPEPAAIALAHAVRYAAWRAAPVETPPAPGDVRRDEAGLLLADARKRGESWLDSHHVRQLLRAYGLPVVDKPAEAPGGVEMTIGVVNDARFGPVIACSAGGALLEVVNDVAVRLSPLTRGDASTMLRELRSIALLEGYRGAPACDTAALEDALVRTSALVEDHPSIVEIELNPVIVGRQGAVIVDARVSIGGVPPRHPIGARL